MIHLSEIAAKVIYSIKRNDAEALLNYASELDTYSSPEADALASDARGWAFFVRSDYTNALKYYHHALPLYVEQGNTRGRARITSNIGTVYMSTGDYPVALEYYQQALERYTEVGDHDGIARVTNNVGTINCQLGNFPTALEHFSRALEMNTEYENLLGVANDLCNLGIVYSSTQDYPAALEYFHRALAIHEQTGDRLGAANVTANIGNIHMHTGSQSLAQEYLQRAHAIQSELGNRSGMANAQSNLGSSCFLSDDLVAALEHFRSAVSLYTELGSRDGVLVATGNLIETQIALGHIAEAQSLLETVDSMQVNGPELQIMVEHNRARLFQVGGDLDNATVTLHRSLDVARKHGLRSQAADAHKLLRDIALTKNDLAGYVVHNNEYTRITEEINGKETATNLAMQAKQREIDAREKEHQKQLAVLHSTLPKHIADRVARGETVNDNYDNAAILFLDIVSFSSYTSNMPPTDVVKMLEHLFTTVDGICETHSVVKIKTIGDSYMCFRGDADATTNANSIAHVAIDVLKGAFTWPDGVPIQFRAGIHIGPATAGVLGSQRLQYDVWGDTVNVASRMESTSEPGRIQISEALANALNEHKNSPPDLLSHASLEREIYSIVPRGTVDVKGKGMMQTYWLDRIA